MKTVTLRSAVMLLSVCAFVAAGCTATQTQRSAGETIDDTTITAKVKAGLIDNDTTSAGQIEVETYRGVVQLNGFVDSNEEKAAATRVAQSVDGVTRVHNNLAIKARQTAANDGDRTIGDTVDDATLTGKVKAALTDDPTTKARQINVTTYGGTVQLSGFVDSTTEKSRAEEVARSVSGVKSVKNELEVKQSP